MFYQPSRAETRLLSISCSKMFMRLTFMPGVQRRSNQNKKNVYHMDLNAISMDIKLFQCVGRSFPSTVCRNHGADQIRPVPMCANGQPELSFEDDLWGR